MTCSCACHEFEENHQPDECYCMRAPSREAIIEAEDRFLKDMENYQDDN